MPKRSDREHWSRFAREWIAWARTPGHDAFWAYRASLLDFVGAGSGEALDVGCGEGRVSREMKTLGYRVTACDPVAALIQAARQARSADAYVIADTTELPLPSSRFHRVVAYNVLMDVKELPGSLAEMRRVLRPDGELILSIVHPFADRGRFSGAGPDAPFVLGGSYFGEERFEGTEARDGLEMHFAGWSRPLETYAAAFEAAGLAIASLREPVPALRDPSERLARWTRIPLFLWLKLRPLARVLPPDR